MKRIKKNPGMFLGDGVDSTFRSIHPPRFNLFNLWGAKCSASILLCI